MISGRRARDSPDGHVGVGLLISADTSIPRAARRHHGRPGWHDERHGHILGRQAYALEPRVLHIQPMNHAIGRRYSSAQLPMHSGAKSQVDNIRPHVQQHRFR